MDGINMINPVTGALNRELSVPMEPYRIYCEESIDDFALSLQEPLEHRLTGLLVEAVIRKTFIEDVSLTDPYERNNILRIAANEIIRSYAEELKEFDSCYHPVAYDFWTTCLINPVTFLEPILRDILVSNSDIDVDLFFTLDTEDMACDCVKNFCSSTSSLHAYIGWINRNADA